MTKPIRVLHVFGRLDSGGAESRTMDIYRKIDKSKVQFDFAIHTNDNCYFTDEVKSLGGKIYKFPRFNGINYFYYKKCWSEFFSSNPQHQIVHGHQTNTGFVYLKEAKANNVKVRIAHSRNSNKENFIKKHICKLSKLYATNLFAVSKLAGLSEFGKKTVERGQVKVLPNSINARQYTYDSNIRRLKRTELSIGTDNLIIHIGRFHSQKNHMFLLEIFKLVLESQPNSKLLLVGDGPLKNEIIKKTIELNIKDKVIIAGIRRDVPELLQSADVLLFPSLFEGLPGVVLEAQASGLPSIISDSITKEVVVTNLVECISLKSGAEFWANKTLGKLLNNERRDTYEEIVRSGYDIVTLSKWYENFYQSIYTPG